MRYDVAAAAGFRRSRSIPVRTTENGGEDVSITGLVVFLAIGAVAGWLAGTLMKGGGFGLLGITAGGLIGSIVTATAGAVLLLFIVGLVRKS
jgi:uncharacterized membrane protein YeaQ/YmgE (transglycosylase-associated protein family)